MLLRMYTRWAQTKGFAVEIDEVQEGQEAGITSATFIVKGRYAFGMLRVNDLIAGVEPPNIGVLPQVADQNDFIDAARHDPLLAAAH